MMRQNFWKTLFILMALQLVVIEADAQRNLVAPGDTEIGVVEHLGDTVPATLRLINEEGDTVMLKEILNKPTIINFVYYRCPGICSPMMSALSETIDILDLEIGKDYQAFTVSFDPTETPDLAISKKNNYLALMQKKDAAKGWHFFTADSANAKLFTDVTGFRYKPQGRDFVHSGVLIILSPEGKITRYIYPGSKPYEDAFFFQPFEMKMSLLDAARGEVRSTVNKVLVYCFNYDPQGQQYVFNITKVAGTVILFFAVIFFIILVIRSGVRRKAGQKA